MPPSPSRPKSRGLAERKASLTAFQRANLLRGNITREVTLPDYVVNQRETQGYSWVLKSLWKKVSGLGAFSEAGHSGDGARVNIVDTAVIEHGGKNIVKDYFTTETDGAKKGYIKRRNGATLGEWSDTATATNRSNTPDKQTRNTQHNNTRRYYQERIPGGSSGPG